MLEMNIWWYFFTLPYTQKFHQQVLIIKKIEGKANRTQMEWNVKEKRKHTHAHICKQTTIIEIHFYTWRNLPSAVTAHRRPSWTIKLIKIYAWQRSFATNVNRYMRATGTDVAAAPVHKRCLENAETKNIVMLWDLEGQSA